jgi:hypothetical protein
MSKLDDLVAKIRASVEIRKRAGGSIAVETDKTRAKRAERERGDDPALTALMRQSNSDTKRFTAKPDPYKHFHEVGRVAVLQKQICRCCDNVQVNVVAEMLHIRGKSNADSPIVDVWIRRSSVQPLPHEEPMWAPAHAVEFCADCILTSVELPCWKTAQLLPEGSGQLPLIN